MDNPSQTLAVAFTGEPCQPARIYYQVSNQKTLIRSFEKLRCMGYDPEEDRWCWMYKEEAKKLKFRLSYNQIPKDVRPVVLGDFRFLDPSTLILDVRSFERVEQGLIFFAKHLNPRIIKPTKVRIVNQIFDASIPDVEELLTTPYDVFFEQDDDVVYNPILEVALTELAQAKGDKENEHYHSFSQYIAKMAEVELPLIEEIKIDSLDDTNFARLRISLMTRHLNCMEEWRLNSDWDDEDDDESDVENLMRYWTGDD